MTINRLNNSTPISAFNADARLDEIKSKIRILESKMGMAKSVGLILGQFNETPCAQLKNNAISLPTWFLFKYEDIPLRFRMTDLNDPRLGDQNFLNELADWMNAKFYEAGVMSVIRPADYGILQAVIKFMRDRDLYEKSKDFTVSHELAHLNHAQVEQQTLYLHNVPEAISVAGILGGILLLFLTVSIIPFVHLAVTLTVGGIAATISTLGILAWLNKNKLLTSLSSKEEEKIADMDAAKALQNAEGGIYLFETYCQQNLAVRRNNPTLRTFIDENGNNLRDKNHPPLTERIAYLRQWQSQHFQRAYI
jgi:hypothetical protein